MLFIFEVFLCSFILKCTWNVIQKRKAEKTTAKSCNHFSNLLVFLCHPPPGPGRRRVRNGMSGYSQQSSRWQSLFFLADRFLHSKRQRQNIFGKYALAHQTFRCGVFRRRCILFNSIRQSPVWLTSPAVCARPKILLPWPFDIPVWLFCFLVLFSFFHLFENNFCQICFSLKRHLKCLNTNRRLFVLFFWFFQEMGR